MKAAAFDYVRAGSVTEAVGLLVQHGDEARLLAGGQSLLPALNLRLSSPAVLVDIGGIAGLRGIAVADGTLRIGAATTHDAVMRSAAVAAHTPLLVRALADVAHPAIRSRGTIGGSLANADPAAELPAVMLAVGARMIIEGPEGVRMVAAEAFFTGLFETALSASEVLVAVEIDAAPGVRWGFAELARRTGDYAMVGLAVHGGRLGYFAVGTRAVLARRAAVALAAEGVEAACLALAEDLEPHADLQASAPMRLHLARVLLRRVMA